MSELRATYRLQFRNGMDFARAAGIVPYLAKLGVSHLYASPVFQATPGSTHGYDTTDHGRFDESLGGLDGFQALSAALGAYGLGLILDIVPNHMAASCHNPWWADVLRHGRRSAYAGYFDVDWSRPKLLLPFLGHPYGDALAAGEFSLGHEPEGVVWHASGQALPLDPATLPMVLDGIEPLNLADQAAFGAWRKANGNASRLDAALAAISRDSARMHEIHEAQNWRLAYWRLARDGLGYRRFFEISELVGVRVEEAAVFDDVHRFLFELVETGQVDGVRVDHVDGLADPTGYLDRLASSLPRPVPIWVEKILERDEHLPATWPVAGASGYESLAVVSAALTNASAESELDRAYDSFTGLLHDYRAMRDAAKREVLTRNLASELEALVAMTAPAFESDPAQRDWGPDTLHRAVVALLVAMPVYRTYFAPGGETTSDEVLLEDVIETARRDPGLDDPTVVDGVAACVKAPGNSAAHAFRTRFQQVSGALMAKAVEDTVFYRFNRLISANEVGADPSALGIDPEDFHAFATSRAASHPMALNASATHDTKRGEDARMRIAAISEAPQRWAEAVAAFESILGDDPDVPEIDAEARWLFYQALLGSWVPDLADALPERTSAFLLKAARESKIHTAWVKTNRDYEARLEQFVERAMSSGAFAHAFAERTREFVAIGQRKSLAQLALKLTLPGIPDIYQGTEITDLSYVDPDNRRTVDYDHLRRLLGQEEEDLPSKFDAIKLSLLRFGLDVCASYPDVFAGGYRPAPVDGRVIAFVREGRDHILMVAVDPSGGQLEGRPHIRWPFDLSSGRPIRSFPRSPDGEGTTDDAIWTRLQSHSVSLVVFEV